MLLTFLDYEIPSSPLRKISLWDVLVLFSDSLVARFTDNLSIWTRLVSIDNPVEIFYLLFMLHSLLLKYSLKRSLVRSRLSNGRWLRVVYPFGWSMRFFSNGCWFGHGEKCWLLLLLLDVDERQYRLLLYLYFRFFLLSAREISIVRNDPVNFIPRGILLNDVR